MRIPKYLSPTSLAKWESDPEEFYLQYLADKRPPRMPQTLPMSVGSSFDAYIKSFFHKELFGKAADPRFEFTTIFEDQVEPDNRDWALEAGKHVFESYKTSGAMHDLLKQLKEAQGEPRFEFTMEVEIRQVNLLGKPDVFFVHKDGKPVILDFKVNGYCGNYSTSPKSGYLKIRDGWQVTQAPASKGANSMYKDAQPFKLQGMVINIGSFLEDVNKIWATQLATYGWLCGTEVGSEFVCALDQLVCKPSPNSKFPLIRIAEHRCLISKEFQLKVIARYSELWEIVHSNHIFKELSFEESAGRCEMLNLQHAAFGEDDDFIKELTGRL